MANLSEQEHSEDDGYFEDGTDSSEELEGFSRHQRSIEGFIEVAEGMSDHSKKI